MAKSIRTFLKLSVIGIHSPVCRLLYRFSVRFRMCGTALSRLVSVTTGLDIEVELIIVSLIDVLIDEVSLAGSSRHESPWPIGTVSLIGGDLRSCQTSS